MIPLLTIPGASHSDPQPSVLSSRQRWPWFTYYVSLKVVVKLKRDGQRESGRQSQLWTCHMVPRPSWPARDNLHENRASSASLGNAGAPVLLGLCPMLMPFREHLSCEAKGQRPWHFILSRAVSTIKMALWKPEAVKYLDKGHQGVRLFLSQQCL